MGAEVIARVPVDEVVLLEDRAHVIRRGVVELPAGAVRLRIERIAPVAADKTLTVAVAEGSAQVAYARIRRRMVVRSAGEAADDEGDVAALEAEKRALEARIAEVEAARDAATREAATLETVAGLTLDDLMLDAAWGRELEASWAERLDSLRRAVDVAADRVLERERELAELGRLRARLASRLAALASPANEARADLEVDLVVEAAGRCQLRIDYIVPGACWRPYHTARLVRGEAVAVEVSTDACVWQNTGEDWVDAQLSFSTERASLGIEPPRLEDDVLSWTRRSEGVVVQAREQAIDAAGLGTAPRTAAAELPGIDDGGQALTLHAPARATVPSDGRPWRVRLTSFSSEAEVGLVAFPELSPCVFTRTVQANRGALPLLAGPVDLVRESGFVGRTSVLFAAPGERFELGWGPEPDLRLRRNLDTSDEKSRVLSSWITRTHVVDLWLSNMGAAERKVEVKERVPVSELEKVKVEIDPQRTSGGQPPDRDGFVTWHVALGPRGHETLKLVYAVKRHESVVGI